MWFTFPRMWGICGHCSLFLLFVCVTIYFYGRQISVYVFIGNTELYVTSPLLNFAFIASNCPFYPLEVRCVILITDPYGKLALSCI